MKKSYFVFCSDNEKFQSTDAVFRNGHSLNNTTQLTNAEIVKPTQEKIPHGMPFEKHYALDMELFGGRR